ncbi:MAG: hypothetical protein NT150_04005 [Bacteroidetes bacterium]|nr:hypothetical protein [Bacteroidota bacterium]
MKNAIKVGLFAIMIAVSATACTDPEERTSDTAPEGEVKAAIDTNKAATPTTPEAGGEVKEEPKG